MPGEILWNAALKRFTHGCLRGSGLLSNNTDCVSDLSSQETCSICLCKTNLDQWMTLLCGHGYCRKCLRTAAKQGHAQCPICRRPHELDSNSSAFPLQVALFYLGEAVGVSVQQLDAAIKDSSFFLATLMAWWCFGTCPSTFKC